MNAPLLHQQISIGRLPNEILRILFSIVAEDSRPQRKRPRVRTCWMRLGHVCTLWRAILLDMSALWARDVLAFGTEHAHDSILARARDAPLDVQWTLPKQTGDVVHMSHLIPRARSLNCTVQLPGPAQAVVRLLTSSTLPRLKTLDIDAVYDEDEPLYTANPDSSLAGLRNLRKLKMLRFYLRPPLHGTLVTLEIIIVPRYGPILGPSVNEILQVLSHNTALERLRLKHVFHGRINTTFIASPIVLPALAFLELSYATNASAPDFINVLRMPAMQDLVINGVGENKAQTIDAALAKMKIALTVCRRVYGALSRFPLALDLNGLVSDPNFQFTLRRDDAPEEREFLMHIPFDRTIIPPLTFLVSALRALSDAQAVSNVSELQAHASSRDMDELGCRDVVFSTFVNASEILITGATDDCAKKLEPLGRPSPDGSLHLPHLHRIIVFCELKLDAVRALARQLRQMAHQRTKLGGPACETWIAVKPRVGVEMDEDAEDEGEGSSEAAGDASADEENGVTEIGYNIGKATKPAVEQLREFAGVLDVDPDGWLGEADGHWMIEV